MIVRVNTLQAATTTFMVTVGTVFFPVAGVVVSTAGNLGWLAVLGAFLISLPWVFMAGKLVRLGPTGNWGQTVIAWLGPWGGRIFLLYFAFVWTWLGGYILAQTGLVFHAIAMPRTPVTALSAALVLLLIQVDLKGVEVFARTLEMLFMLILVLSIGFVISVIPGVSLDNLLPLLDEPPIRVGHAALLVLPWAMEGILFFAFIGSHVLDRKKLGRVGAGAIMLGGFCLALVVVMTLGLLGRTVTELHIYPTMAAAQTAHLGFFLQGLEVFMFPIWLMASFVKAGACFVLVSESLRGVYAGFGQPYRALLVAAVFMGVARIPTSTAEAGIGLARVDNTFFMSFYVLLPLVLVWAIIRNGKGGKG